MGNLSNFKIASGTSASDTNLINQSLAAYSKSTTGAAVIAALPSTASITYTTNYADVLAVRPLDDYLGRVDKGDSLAC